MSGAAILLTLLSYAVITLWVDARWAWAAFQLAIFILAASRPLTTGRHRIPWTLAPLAAASLWPWIQLARGASASPSNTVVEALNWCTFLLVFAVSADILTLSGVRTWFLTAAAFVGAFVAFLGTVQKYTSGGRIFWIFDSGFADDVFGPFVNRNQFAAWIELLLPIALVLAVTERRLRPGYVCAAAAMFGSVVASGSRAGALLAIGEVGAVLAALSARHAAPRKAIVLGALQFLILAAVATSIFGYDTLEARFRTSGPERIRIDAVHASLQMVRSRPVMGFGLGAWPAIYPAYAGFDPGVAVNQAHNDWAQWAAEGGLPFLGFLIIFAALLCKPAIRSIYGVGTVAFLLHAFVDYPMQQRPALAAWFFAIAGAVVASANRARQV